MLHTREADGGSERCVNQIVDASLGVIGSFLHGFTPRQTCTKHFNIWTSVTQVKKGSETKHVCAHLAHGLA